MDVLLYIGSTLVLIWGVAHIVPTKSVVKGFGGISEDNIRIITMEWVAEGLTLCFIGLLVLLVTVFGNLQNQVAAIVYWTSAGMLVIMAIWTMLTGARTSVIPIKVCPVVKTTAAVLIVLGSLL
ncbi:MAG: hypothetical protein JSW16_05065 [Dehalococcoidales bacterium]|nr:MAG: hypothetical protein JSW16_05065 [Dehalococcoidales bacterium]